MKLLLIHADSIEWEATKKAVRTAEELNKKSDKSSEVLVAFSAVEKDDEKNPNKVAENGVKEILDTLDKVKAKNLVIYPYAHLSPNLSSPSTAMKVLQKMEKDLAGKIPTKRAPFGWYKSFSIKTKGHPMSELSKQVNAEAIIKKKAPAKIILDRKSLPPNDHRILGEELGIFHFSDEVGAGLPLWLPNGATLRFELEKYMREVEEKYNYKYVKTPDIMKGEIFEASGHLPYYKDSMYSPIEIDGVDYYLRPMNCPPHHMIYKKLVTSYRDLPLRLAEAGTTYRHELSGVTYGLIRVRCFTINDTHIYVTPDQLKKEFISVLKMFDEVYKTMGISGYWFRLSLPDFKKNPDKFTGDPKEWDFASQEIRNAMKEHGCKFVEEKGEASFYGPKIDVQIKNILGKEETIATSQVDIVVPKRMGLTYSDKKDIKKYPIIIHRAILGSYERFIAYLLEQSKGHLPTWLAPVQVRVLSFTDRNTKAVEKLVKEFREQGLRAETDIRDHTVDYKIRESETQKIPYAIVLGDKEEKANTLAVRRRGIKKVQFGIKKDAFLKQILDEIKHKK